MATETGPDLTVAIEAIRKLMDDTCIIRRDQGSENEVLDPVTGEVGPAVPPTLVYDGPCLVGKQGDVRPQVNQEGGVQFVPTWYEVSLPVTAPAFEIGDRIEITSSRWNAQLVGEDYRIRDVPQETFLVSRDLVAERR